MPRTVTRTWTDSPSGTSELLDVEGDSLCALSISTTNAVTAFVFEISDDFGHTWFPVALTNGLTRNIDATPAVTAAASYWYTALAGATHVRIRLTAPLTGSLTLMLHSSVSDAPTALASGGGGGGGSVTQGTTPWTIAGTVTANVGSGTQAVSIASLPLPAGAAAETTLAAINTKLPASPAQEHTTAGAPASVRLSNGSAFITPTTPLDTQPISGTVIANAGSGTFAVSAASLPLPASAAQEHTSAGSPSSVRLTDGSAFYKPTTPSDTQPVSGTITANAGSGTFTVSGTVTANVGSGTQPVSGTVTANAGTGTMAVSAASLPLPSGASQEHTTAGSPSSVRLTDGSAFYKPTTPSDTQPISGTVSISGTSTVSGTVTANAGTGTMAVSAASLPLPIGAATETTLGTRLTESTYITRQPTVGQKAMTGSVPVAIASDQSMLDARVRETPLRTYGLSVSAQANTTSSDIFVLESGTSARTRIRQIIVHPGSQTAAGLRLLQLVRTTTAGTGGAVTPNAFDASDVAFSGVWRAKPTAQGAAGAVLLNIMIMVPTSANIATGTPTIINFGDGQCKFPAVTVGASNGIALRDPGASSAASLACTVIFTEE